VAELISATGSNALKDVSDPLGQVYGIERFGDVVNRAFPVGITDVLGRGSCREKHDRDLDERRVGPQRMDDIVTVELGKHHVEQDQVGPMLASLRDPLASRLGFIDLEAGKGEIYLAEQAKRWLIVDDENATSQPA
jgi:hypothetical protein